MEQLTQDQIHQFFSTHFRSLPRRDQVALKCPFHEDKVASLSINLKDGIWSCHAGCGEGGMIDFEMLANKCDHDTARGNVNAILGANVFGKAEKPEAVYQYKDARGIVVFEKVRYPGKHFQNRRPAGNGFEYKLGDIKKPLYNLPDVITAAAVCVVEGEKDADNLSRALAPIAMSRGDRLAITTNFDGAGKWREEYSPYFTGKKVFIFPDNDSLGKKHADNIATALHPYALGIKIIELPGLDDKGDVSDFLKHHTGSEVIEYMVKAEQWHPAYVEQKLFVAAPKFIATIPDSIDWLVEGVVQRGANGFFVADPKAGKSWAAVDMAIAVATGEPWMGFKVPLPTTVALVSREDSAGLTAWRLKHLWRGRSVEMPWLIDTNLYVNTKLQSPELMLDNDEQFNELMAALRTVKPGFIIFDVFNVIHGKDENDNQEMRSVLRRLSKIQASLETKPSIAVVHHFNKGDAQLMTKRMRGSSAIAGWAEWLIGISVSDPATQTRRMEFELKAAQPPDPILYQIVSQGETAKLQPTNDRYLPPKPKTAATLFKVS